MACRGSALALRILRFGRSISSEAIVYDTYGDPVEVTRISTREHSALKETDILVDMLRAPVNPADVNKIQGTYPEKSVLPAVGGNEGVAIVREVGRAVKNLCPGDHVIPALAGIGTWQTGGVFQANDWIKIARDLPLNLAATLLVNPCTAYRMLKDFMPLYEGDTIIQNGANSGVGQAVIQLAAKRNIRTINIVRDRPSISSLRHYLISELKATVVVTEEQLCSREMQSVVKEHGRPKLALNCVGGRNATEMLRYLATGGTMVTYGGMARKPVTIPVSAFIFKDFKAVGYWNSQWLKDNLRSVEHDWMLKELSDLALEGHLKAPKCTEVSLKDYKEVLSQAMKPFISSKFIFVFRQ